MGSVRLKNKENVINAFILQGCIELINSDRKIYLMLQIISISNKCYSFEHSIDQNILKNQMFTKILGKLTYFPVSDTF